MKPISVDAESAKGNSKVARAATAFSIALIALQKVLCRGQLAYFKDQLRSVGRAGKWTPILLTFWQAGRFAVDILSKNRNTKEESIPLLQYLTP